MSDSRLMFAIIVRYLRFHSSQSLRIPGQDVERIVVKLANGVYEPRATTWVKIKNRTYSQAAGRLDSFDPSHSGW